MTEHDSNYKQLFSHAQLVEDLLRGFVPADWVAELDFSTLEKVNASYITDDLQGRADDVIWKVRWQTEDVWLYIYLLLEFQATIDAFMAVRIMTYVGLLYQDLIKSKHLSPNGKLPPVLPLVLYNGKDRRWNASQEISKLIEPLPKGLAKYCPHLRYLFLDESRYSQAQLPLRNLVSAVFKLEHSCTQADFMEVLDVLLVWIKEPAPLSLDGFLGDSAIRTASPWRTGSPWSSPRWHHYPQFFNSPYALASLNHRVSRMTQIHSLLA